ncbi:MAG: STAS/SEC14 domain-containing protein [Bacteroidia bacterium]
MKTIETEFYVMHVHDDLLVEYYIKEGVTHDIDIAIEAKEALMNYKPGARFYVIAEGKGFFRATRKVRELSASAEFSSHMKAVAFVTNNFSLALLGDLYNKLNKPAVVTKIFSNREAAMEWLRAQMEMQPTAGI